MASSNEIKEIMSNIEKIDKKITNHISKDIHEKWHNPIFKYGDNVRINNGFYKDMEGEVIEYDYTRDPCPDGPIVETYIVRIRDCDHENIRSFDPTDLDAVRRPLEFATCSVNPAEIQANKERILKGLYGDSCKDDKN